MAKDKERPNLTEAMEFFRNDIGVEEFNKGVQEIVDKLGFTTKQAEFLFCINLSPGAAGRASTTAHGHALEVY